MIVDEAQVIEVKRSCYYCTSQLDNEMCDTCNAHSNFQAATGGE